VADLKIRVFKGGETDPKKTITIPGGVLRIASKKTRRLRSLSNSGFGEATRSEGDVPCARSWG
jgi:hypothetical protein